jgi:hypothetical protein
VDERYKLERQAEWYEKEGMMNHVEQTWDIVSQIPGFAAEIALTKRAFTGGKGFVGVGGKFLAESF